MHHSYWDDHAYTSYQGVTKKAKGCAEHCKSCTSFHMDTDCNLCVYSDNGDKYKEEEE